MMKLLHISDLHFREHYQPASHGYLSVVAQMTSPLIHLEKVFSKIDLAQLNGVVITGDLTENGSAGDYALLKNFLDQKLGKLPIMIALGNHDDKAAFRAGWGLPLLEDAYSPYNALWELSGRLVISLDNAISGYPNGAITPEQVRWLRGVLSSHPDQEKILIFHHNILPIIKEIPPACWDQDFFDLIKGDDFAGILCGHNHHQYVGSFAGVPYSVAPSLSFRGKNDGENGVVDFEEYPGYQVCEFLEGGMLVKPTYLYETPRFITAIDMGEIKI